MKGYFSLKEKILWSLSMILILGSFFLFDRTNYTALTASVIGASSLMLCAKGNPLGHILGIIFCTIYGIISYTYRYYGEVITYACMTLPMSIIALISWLRNPFDGNHAEVTINSVKKSDVIKMLVLSVVVAVCLYFVLKYMGTENLAISTLSVITSFIAVYLSYKRSPYFALAYAVNDIVLIVLWILASIEDITYLSVVICFITFLVNDIYGYYNWKKIQKRQQREVM